jgi:hypothetical protein
MICSLFEDYGEVLRRRISIDNELQKNPMADHEINAITKKAITKSDVTRLSFGNFSLSSRALPQDG